MDSLREQIPHRLRKAREIRGWTQKEAARVTGINPKTLSGYECGVSQPDLQTLNILAGAYRVSTDYLLCRTNIPNPLGPAAKLLLPPPDAWKDAPDYLSAGNEIIRIQEEYALAGQPLPPDWWKKAVLEANEIFKPQEQPAPNDQKAAFIKGADAHGGSGIFDKKRQRK